MNPFRLVRLRGHALAIAFLALLAMIAPGVALAHPQVLRTEPPADAQLTASPPWVRVFYNEQIETAFAEIRVFDAQAQQVNPQTGGRSPSDPTVVEAPMPPLAPGLYTAVWQVVGSDGHLVKGNFVFSVLASNATSAPGATPAPQPTPSVPVAPIAPPAEAEPPTAWLALFRGLMLLGALVAVGGYAIAMLVLFPALPTGAQPGRDAAFRRWRWTIWIGLALLVVAALAFALVQTYSAAGRIDAADLLAFYGQTRLGQAIQARLWLALAFALLAAFRPAGLRRWLALVLGALLLLTFSASGHAAAEPAPLLPVFADWLHLAAVALWVGGLVQLVFTLPAGLTGLTAPRRIEVLAQTIARFSTVALISVIVLTISGTYSALLHLNSISDLWTSDYGRALLAKLVLFGALMAFGAYNLFIVRPRFIAFTHRAAEMLVAQRLQERFQWLVRGEVLLAVLTLGAAGYLTSVAPPASTATPGTPLPVTVLPAITMVPESSPAPTRTPVPSVIFEQTQQVEDVKVGLRVEPASIGKNTFVVTVQDQQGAPLDVQKVVIAFDMPTMEMGVTQADMEHQAPGTYVAKEQWVSMVGDWHVVVEVRRRAADDVKATFVVPVGG